MMDEAPPNSSGVDLYGYFQNEASLSLYSIKEAKEWLQFKPEWIEKFPRKHEHYIAIHQRHGDYVSRYLHQFCVPKPESAMRLAKYICADFGDMPIVVVSEENAEDYDDPELSFLPDFFTLMQSDYLIRANSSFSWWAATLGNGVTFCPMVGDMVGWQDVSYISGNSEPFLIYPHHGYLYLRPE